MGRGDYIPKEKLSSKIQSTRKEKQQRKEKRKRGKEEEGTGGDEEKRKRRERGKEKGEGEEEKGKERKETNYKNVFKQYCHRGNVVYVIHTYALSKQ